MKKGIVLILIFIISNTLKAQTGIGTLNPTVSSVVEMASTNKGVLLPRVTLASITDVVTITSPANALTVFNTAAAGVNPNNVIPGYYYWSGAAAKWIRLLDAVNSIANIYTADGSLTGNRTVAQGTNTLNFTGSVNNAFSIDNTTVSVDAANHRVGIGTTSPGAKLEIASGTANASGLKFKSFNSSTPLGTGQTIGVDASGNVITLSNPGNQSAVTKENAYTSGANFNVNDLGFTLVTNSSQSLSIPVGGKALFINFMLGIDFNSNPTGSGDGNYEACLFIDNLQSNVLLITTEPASGGSQTQYSFACVKFLAAGTHTIDVRMIRSANNGTQSGANMACVPISMSFNATYLN